MQMPQKKVQWLWQLLLRGVICPYILRDVISWLTGSITVKIASVSFLGRQVANKRQFGHRNSTTCLYGSVWFRRVGQRLPCRGQCVFSFAGNGPSIIGFRFYCKRLLYLKETQVEYFQ